MSVIVFALFLSAAFVLGVWLGFHAAHHRPTDIADYLTSSPAGFGPAGVARPVPDPPQPGAGRPTKPTTK